MAAVGGGISETELTRGVLLSNVNSIKARASSALGGSKKKHGPKLALDSDNADGAWSTEAGDMHWLELRMLRSVHPRHLEVQF